MSHEDRTEGAVANAFSPEFLALLRQLPEPSTAAEAEMAGPWKMVPVAQGEGLFRSWEDPAAGDEPFALFPERETALLFLSVLPLFAQEARFRGTGSAADGAKGVRIQRDGVEVGWCQVFSENLFFAAHLAEALARSPWALAAVMQAAGPLVIEQVGRILRAEMR